jgi:hypothetical protein
MRRIDNSISTQIGKYSHKSQKDSIKSISGLFFHYLKYLVKCYGFFAQQGLCFIYV